ncbi:MAG: hypothetical protein Phog2KO_50720 [Phototrophicaceae bacterium]
MSVHENQLSNLPTEISNLSNLRIITLADNPLISPPPEVIDQGTPAILDYLENRALWHFQRLMLSVLGGLGVIVLVILGLRYRQRGLRKPKQKRGEA